MNGWWVYLAVIPLAAVLAYKLHVDLVRAVARRRIREIVAAYAGIAAETRRVMAELGRAFQQMRPVYEQAAKVLARSIRSPR